MNSGIPGPLSVTAMLIAPEASAAKISTGKTGSADHVNGARMVSGMQADGLHRPLNGLHHVPIGGRQRLARARELQQRVDEIGHEIHARPYFLIEFLALHGSQMAVDQEFRVGDDRGQRVTKVMRD